MSFIYKVCFIVKTVSKMFILFFLENAEPGTPAIANMAQSGRALTTEARGNSSQTCY